MKKLLLLGALVLSSSTALAQKPTNDVPAVKLTPSVRDAFRMKVAAAVQPASKPKVDNIIAILIGLLTAEKPETLDGAFDREGRKAFPKADAAQLEALKDLVVLQLNVQLRDRLAERRLRAGISSAVIKCKKDAACVEKHTSGADRATVEKIRKELEAKSDKDLEAQDKLGNFEIQQLVSAYNQSETLASSIEKKKADAAAAVIGKI